MGEQKHVSFSREAITYSFEDYPPGTPLPGMAALDTPNMNPLLKKVRLQRQARLEAARDEYWRRKADPSDEGNAD